MQLVPVPFFSGLARHAPDSTRLDGQSFSRDLIFAVNTAADAVQYQGHEILLFLQHYHSREKSMFPHHLVMFLSNVDLIHDVSPPFSIE